jgi:hypothetical protein
MSKKYPSIYFLGGLVGILFASVTLLVCADIFNKQSAFWKNYRYAVKKGENCGHGACEKLVERTGELQTFQFRFSIPIMF